MSFIHPASRPVRRRRIGMGEVRVCGNPSVRVVNLCPTQINARQVKFLLIFICFIPAHARSPFLNIHLPFTYLGKNNTEVLHIFSLNNYVICPAFPIMQFRGLIDILAVSESINVWPLEERVIFPFQLRRKADVPILVVDKCWDSFGVCE